MTSAWLQGEKTSIFGHSPYICRPKEPGRTRRRHSNFWVGLYGHNWIVAFHECQDWVAQLVASVRNKRTFYQRGLKALTLIQQARKLACRPLKLFSQALSHPHIMSGRLP